MNILFVCHRFPYPPNRGGKIRPFNMIRHLAQKHRVIVATLAHSQQEVAQGAELRNHCHEVLVEVIPSAKRWMRAMCALPTLNASSAHYFWSAKLDRRIQQLQSRMPVDAVIVHCAFVAPYVRRLQAPFRMLDFGDLDSRKWSDYAKYQPFPWSAGYALEAFKLQRIERKLASEFDQCTVTAQGEFQSYQEMGVATPCQVIPNGVDAEYFHVSGNRPEHSNVIVFLGRMDYFPNIAGILHFVKDVFPLVRKRNPGAHLRIVGSNPVPAIQKLSLEPGISVTGHVPDVRPHVHDAGVAIAPLSIARGTQNKVLECMAMGIPVVASPQVAKGVQAAPDHHLLVGHAPHQFADHVVQLLNNPELRGRIAGAGRKQVLSTHSWAASMKLLDSITDNVSGQYAALRRSHATASKFTQPSCAAPTGQIMEEAGRIYRSERND